MAKNDNLVHYLTDIANAIREKNGTNDPINAQDFADEIKNGGNSGGGSASKWKYYDCLGDEKDESGYISHGTWMADNVKVMDSVTGNLMIAPEAYIDSDEPNTIVAVAYDMNKRVYVDGKWVPFEELITAWEGIDFSAHPEITEEEFYNIPNEVVWEWHTAEEGEVYYNKLKELIDRYGAENVEQNGLSIIPWFKSLTLIDSSPNAYGDVTKTEVSVNSIRYTNDKQVWGTGVAEAINFDEWGDYSFFKLNWEDGKTYYKLGYFGS